jgi:cold shock CspA family protein
MSRSSISSNKKELEKRKQSKRLEKQKRKEERKANGVSSFDDMIAYVDENGNITDTPPIMDGSNEVDADTIDVSVPKKEEPEEEPIKTGFVEFFNEDKGFGFIKDSNSVEKYFFHISSAPKTITKGNKVTFELERGKRGMNAVNVNIVK